MRRLVIAALLFSSCTTGGITVERETLDRIDQRTAAMEKRYEEFNKRLYEADQARKRDQAAEYTYRKLTNDQLERLRVALDLFIASLRIYLGLPLVPQTSVPSATAPAGGPAVLIVPPASATPKAKP